jgi:hypothetical protein
LRFRESHGFKKMALIDPAPMHRMRMLGAVLISVAAVMIALAALWSSPTGAAPTCLTQPNLKAADGRHWYYRTDQATKRKCWFVKPRSESLGQAAAKEPPAAKPNPPTPKQVPVQAIWDGLFPSTPLYEPPARYTDTDRPIDSVPVPIQDRNTADATGTSDRGEPPPTSAAFTAGEPPAPAIERQNLALIAVALLLIALAVGAGVKHWGAGRVAGDRRADYTAVLSRAIANADPDDREARRNIYDCARRVLVSQLRAADPPVGESIITAEQAALDAAITQIELQSTQRDKQWASSLREPADRAFTPRFGSGGTRPSTRRRLGDMATWALRASRPA